MKRRNLIRRILALLLIFTMTAGLAPVYAATATAGDGTTCDHQPTSKIIPADCENPSRYVMVCAICGKELSDPQPSGEPLGHAPEVIPAVEATCTAGGKTEGSRCSRCGKILTAQTDTPAKGHTPEVIPGVPATCETPGKTEGSRCSTCGAILSAQADIPATGHNWGGWVVDVPPNCEQGGLEYMTCLNCGAQQWRYGEALGHDWDEGQVFDAGYLTPGATVYTCRRCGETKEEEIPVETDLSSVTKLLTGGGSKAPVDKIPEADGTELRVVTQPVGGSIARGGEEMCAMHVIAAGGVPPYEYQWFRECDYTIGKFPIPNSFGGSIAAAEAQAADGYKGMAGKIAAIIQGEHTISGTLSEFDPTKHGFITLNTSALNNSGTSGRIGSALADAEYETYGAVSAGKYYCKITDSEGNYVYSDSAEVWWRIRIVTQPANGLNIDEAVVYLHAEATDGRLEEGQDYIYCWYCWYDDENGYECENDGDDPSTIHITQPGVYSCLVADVDETVWSDKVTVYDYTPLDAEMYFTSPEKQFLSNDDGAWLTIVVLGGMPPYRIEWGPVGEEEVLYESLDESLSIGNKILEPGTYHLHVVDSLNHNASVYQTVYNKQLEIQEQPTGGTLAADGSPHTLNITMKNGQQPFTYYLYTEDDFGNFWCCDEIEDANWMESFDVYFDGYYYIEVVDAEHSFARSDTVQVEAYHELEITDMTPDGIIDDPEKPYQLKVTAAGGEAPYTYQWHRMVREEFSTDRELAGETKETMDLWPDAVDYWYYCEVTDSAGNSVKSDLMTAEFKGRKPFIIEQPWSNSTVTRGGAMPTLTCRAVCGDGWAPRYCWQYYLDGEWHDTIGTGTTFKPIADYVYGGAGAWRCKVTDPRSCKSVYSNTVYVYMDMKILTFEQVGYEKQLKVTFEGGVSPYKIDVRSRHTSHLCDYGVDEYDVSFRNTGINLGTTYFGRRVDEHDETWKCSIDLKNIYDYNELDISVPCLYSREHERSDLTFTLFPPFIWVHETYVKVPYMYMVTITDAVGNTVSLPYYIVCQWK